MKTNIKTSHGVAILAGCLIVALVGIGQMSKQNGTVSLSAPLSVQPGTQLAQVSQTATLAVSPTSNSVVVGNNFTVTVALNTGGNGTYGVDINKLHFNPAVLQVVDADSGTAGVQIAPGALMANTVINTVDNVGGTIQFSQLANPPTTFNGSGTLATITFHTIAAGTSAVTFDFTLGSGTDSNVAGLGGDMLASVTNGSYTVTALPVVSAVNATSITSSGATITWTTNVSADSQVQYGTTASYGSNTTLNSSLVTSHSVAVSGLSASTIYHYRVLSHDGSGNLATSADNTFTTGAPADVTPPVISALAISNITTTGATVTWTTDEAADTQVVYGATASYTLSTTLNSSLVTSHTATLSGLSPGTSYHYAVRSHDAAGNLAQSVDNVLTTQTAPDTTAPTVPTGLSATPTSGTQIQLSWNASTDPTGAGQAVTGVANYLIFRGGVQIGASASTAYLDTGLTAGVSYSYQVSAVDGATPPNVSAKSSAVATTTPLQSLNVQRTIQISLQGAPASTGQAVTGTVSFLDPATASQVYQATITTGASGQYLLTVPAGLLPTVNMRLKVAGYLSNVITNVDLRNVSVLTVTFPPLQAGDFNSDQLINSLDFSYMNSKWGTNDALSDIDRNGIVNTIDFSYVSNNWLLAGQ